MQPCTRFALLVAGIAFLIAFVVWFVGITLLTLSVNKSVNWGSELLSSFGFAVVVALLAGIATGLYCS